MELCALKLALVHMLPLKFMDMSCLFCFIVVTCCTLRGGVYTRTLLRKTNQNLPFIRGKSYRLGCSFALIQQQCAMKTATFKSGSKSMYFENGTTTHLLFSVCKQQKTVQNWQDSYSAHDFYFVLH